MLVDILITTKRTLIALSVGVSLGFMLGIVLSFIKSPIIEMIISAFMTIPGMALAPFAIMLLGFGDMSIIVVAAIAALFPVVFNVMAGINTVPSEIIQASCIDGANWFQVLAYVKIPVASKMIATGIELALAKSWRTVIAVEFVASTNYGIGYAMWNATEYLRYDVVILGILFAIMGHWILNQVLQLLSYHLSNSAHCSSVRI